MSTGRPRLDLTNKKVGLLTIVGPNGITASGHSLWDCICECGKWFIVQGTFLNKAKVKSCKSCATQKNIAGRRFGKLIAQKRVGKNQYGMSRWLCICDCGSSCIVEISKLTTGHTASCGHCPRNIFIKGKNYCEGYTADKRKFLFSFEDWEKVTSLNWWFDAKGYVETKINKKNIKLHRFIMQPPTEVQVDHINREKSDCRRCNMRLVTNQQNAANVGAHKDNLSTGHKNVYMISSNKFRVIIRKNGKGIHYGYFDALEKAIQTANYARLKLFGKYGFFDDFKNQK